MQNKVDCLKCIHFYVTWDRSFPKGCKLFGFKTAKMPYALVLESTGKMCEHFEPKLGRKK